MAESMIEKYGLEVANEINPGGAGQAGFTDILEKIISIVTGLIGNCPFSRQAKAKAVSNPTLLQRVALRRRIFEEIGGSFRERDNIFDALIAKGKGMPSADALALVDEVTQDRFTLG